MVPSRRQALRWQATFAVGLALWCVGTTAAASPPLRRWFTIHTDCCDVTYHDGTEETARRYATAAQEAHDVLIPMLGHVPRERTQLLVTDDTDSSNGSATPLPYNTIRAYARPPGSFSDLADYDDWARALILHEVTHIIHTDTIRGIPWLTNWIFGKVWPPNMLQPRWFVEGLAVFAETRLTSAGRAQSSLFDMYLRTAALSGRLWDLDVLSSGGRAFPAGNGAYLYGGHFLQWVARRYGDHVFAGMSRRYSGAVVPYAIDWAAAPFTDGKTWATLFDEWRTDLTRDAVALRERVQRAGATVERRLTALGGSVMFPRALPDGRVVTWASPVDAPPALHVVTARAGVEPIVQRLSEAFSVQGISPAPDGRSVVFAQPEVFAGNYAYLDLFRADLVTGDVKRITAGARLRDPDVHPDGRMAMAVENRAGDSRLVMVDLESGVVRGLFSFDDAAEIHSPRFNHRGDAVVFTAWRAGGYRDVYLLQPGATQPTALTHDRAMDMHPVFSGDGNAVYFSSDRDGVFNIYRRDLRTGEENQVTRVVTGAFMPVPMEAQGALLYVGFGEDAFDLHAAPLPSSPLPATPPPMEGPGRPLPVVRISEPEPYNPLLTIFPRTWTPQVGFSSALGVTVGATISGADLVGYHAYELAAKAILPTGDYAWSAGYVFSGLPMPLTWSATGYSARAGTAMIGDGVRTPYVEDVLRMEVGTQIPVVQWRQGHTFTLAYGQEVRRERVELRLRPDGALPVLPGSRGHAGYLSMGWSYANVRSVRDGVVPERGRRMGARVRLGHTLLISDTTFFEMTGDYREYIGVPALPRHTWVLAMSGGVARGNPWRRRVFFLGGMPRMNLLFLPVGANLRGYPYASEIGDGFVALNAEWHFPLLELQQGVYALPFFLDRLHGFVYGDAGMVFVDRPGLTGLKRGVGAELVLDSRVFHYVPLRWRVGVARGLDRGGQEMQFYTSVGLE